MNNLCLSCLKGFNGRNGNGYMPCRCAANALNSLDKKRQKEIISKLCDDVIEQCEALRTKPEYVEPPPLIKIGDSDSKEKSGIFLLIACPFFVFVVGAIVGLFIK